MYKQNKIANVVGKILTKAGVELPGSVKHEQGLIKAKKTEGDFFKKKKRISKKGLKNELLGALNIETDEDTMHELLAKKERKARGPVSDSTKEKLRAKAKARHAAKLLDPIYKPKEKPVKVRRK